MSELAAMLGGLLMKMERSMMIGLIMGGMSTVFALLILVRVRAAKNVRHACMMSVVSGAVVGTVLAAINLFT